MAPLVWIASHLRAIAAPHVPFQFMDRRRLRAANDVQGYGLMRVATEAANFEIAKPGVERIPERGRRLRGPLEGEHPLIPSLAGQAVGLFAGFRRPLRRGPNACAVDGFSRFGAHSGRGCAGPRQTGKPLQVAVNNRPDTTEATTPI